MCTGYMTPDQQDKRSVMSIEFADVDQWLHGSTEGLQASIRVPSLEALEAGPEKQGRLRCFAWRVATADFFGGVLFGHSRHSPFGKNRAASC